MSRLWVNTLWKASALLGSKLLIFVFILAAAHLLDLADFGYLTFALAFAHIAFVLVDAGVSTALWREASTADDGGLGNYQTARRLRIGSEIIGLTVVFLGFFFFDLPPVARALLILVGLGVGLDAFVHLDQALLKAREHLREDALIILVDRVVFFVLAIIGLLLGGGLIAIGGAYLVGHACALMLARRFTHELNAEQPTQPAQWRPLLRLALPLAAVDLFTIIYFRIDLIMLQGMVGPEAAGLYGAAYRLIEAAMILPAAFFAAVFPRLARQTEGEKHNATADASLRMLGHVATAGVAFGLVFAPEIVTLFFGDAFAPAINALRILLIALWFIYPNYLLTHLLLAHREQNFYAIATGVLAVVNIAANAALITWLGIYGAAIATVLTEALLFAFCVRRLRRRNGAIRLQNLVISLHYGAVYLGLLFAIKALYPDWALPTGVAILAGWAAIALVGFHRRETA